MRAASMNSVRPTDQSEVSDPAWVISRSSTAIDFSIERVALFANGANASCGQVKIRLD